MGALKSKWAKIWHDNKNGFCCQNGQKKGTFTFSRKLFNTHIYMPNGNLKRIFQRLTIFFRNLFGFGRVYSLWKLVIRK